jgi:O-antigen/teichoic acid export membrane protein
MAAIAAGALTAGLTGAVITFLMSQLLTALWLAWTVLTEMRAQSIGLRFHDVANRCKELVRIGFPFYAAGVVTIPVTYYMQGLLAEKGGLEALGQLRVIAALVMIVSFVPTSAAGPMISMLAETRRTSAASLPHNIMTNVKIMLLFGLVVAAVVTIALPWIVPVVFGSAYSEVIALGGIALASAVFAAVGSVMGNALFSVKRVDLVFATAVIQSGVFGAAGVLLIPEYGLAGYLVAELLGYAVLLVSGFISAVGWLARNAVPMNWLAKMVVPAVLLFVYVRLQSMAGGVSVGMGALALAGLVATCLWGYWQILDSAERGAIRRVLGRAN